MAETPKMVPAPIDGRATNAGEIVVVDGVGCIQSPDPTALFKVGVVLVTKDQAERARGYGWERLDRLSNSDGLVRIRRDYDG